MGITNKWSTRIFSWRGVNGTGSMIWFILNDGVALVLFSALSCMSLFVFAMTQLWQDYVKNMAWWVSKELWDRRECVLIIRNTNFIPILYKPKPSTHYDEHMDVNINPVHTRTKIRTFVISWVHTRTRRFTWPIFKTRIRTRTMMTGTC
jgi:hypothetical protein